MANDSKLNSPMASRPWSQQGTGGQQLGDKDGLKAAVALGAPPSSTAGGPVGMQITEELGRMPGAPTMPTGTAIRG
jgi:hypothetical protein